MTLVYTDLDRVPDEFQILLDIHQFFNKSGEFDFLLNSLLNTPEFYN